MKTTMSERLTSLTVIAKQNTMSIAKKPVTKTAKTAKTAKTTRTIQSTQSTQTTRTTQSTQTTQTAKTAKTSKTAKASKTAAHLAVASPIKRDRRELREFAVPGASGTSGFLFNGERRKGDNKPANRRRDCMQFFVILLRFCGGGMLKHVGEGLTDRALVNFRLQFLFGDTFAKGGSRYANPNVNELLSALIHRARYGVPGAAGLPATTVAAAPVFIANLFTHHASFGRWEVNVAGLASLRYSKKKLTDMFFKSRANVASYNQMDLPVS